MANTRGELTRMYTLEIYRERSRALAAAVVSLANLKMQLMPASLWKRGRGCSSERHEARFNEADEDYALFSPTESFDSSRSTRGSFRRCAASRSERSEKLRATLISAVTRRNGCARHKTSRRMSRLIRN